RNIARASTTKRAQSRRRQLEKMTRLEKPMQANETPTFSFPIVKESGNNVLQLHELSVTYEHEPVFSDVHLHITKAERIAIVGPNGIGKSTLLKAIIQQ